MDLSAVDLAGVVPALDGIVALTARPGAGVLDAGRGAAEALLAQPAHPLESEPEVPVGGWIALRRDGDATTEVSVWRATGDGDAAQPPVSLEASWRDGTFVGVTVMAGGRMWSTFADGAGGTGGRAPGGEVAAAFDWDDWPERSRRIREEWERENHATRGWTCPACSWDNERDDAECAACRTPRVCGPGPSGAAIVSTASGAAASLEPVSGGSIPVGRLEVDPGPLLDGLLEETADTALADLGAAMRTVVEHGRRDRSVAEQSRTTCPGCGQSGLRAGAVFCGYCGREVAPQPAPERGSPESGHGARSCEMCGQRDLPEAAAVCPRCGYPTGPHLPVFESTGRTCPFCGMRSLSPDAAFCGRCGRAVDPRR